MSLYQVSPGNEHIVTHGFNKIGNVLFAVDAISAGEGGEVAIEATSSRVASSGSNVNSHHKYKIQNKLISSLSDRESAY